ncbi:unnamed protein product [Cylicostephanus goldi]|uniref:Uncharacterized protein n=1 Tax=Cylicostephanus goldi TaxID=71465 RepID=A0A3P7MV40_CYLGO|nr:unnamed protein product [Cylicostephanus goldi]
MHQPVVKEVLGDVHLCDKPSQFNQAKFNEFSSKHAPKPEKKKEGWSFQCIVFAVMRFSI